MLRLVEFYWDCGRMGTLNGLSIYTDEEWNLVQERIGTEVYFGEVLGKHSEIYGHLEEADLTIKSDDQDFLEKLMEIFPNRHLSGRCLIDYLVER